MARKANRCRKKINLRHKDEMAKAQAWRKKQEGKRLDGYINNSASWRLKKLSETWGCSLAGAVERLALEADEKYSDILFPDHSTRE